MDAGQKLGERERLRQVIVAAGLEAADAIIDGTLGAEEEDGGDAAGGTTKEAILESSSTTRMRIVKEWMVADSGRLERVEKKTGTGL